MPAIIQPPDARGYVAKEEPKELVSRITYLPTSEYNALTSGLIGVIYEDTQSAGRPQKRWDPVALAFVSAGSGSAVTVVNDVVTGGATAALSAEQGVVLSSTTASLVAQLVVAMNNAIAEAKEAALDLRNATFALSTTKVESANGENLEARLVRIEAGLAPASSTDPAVTAPPTLTGTIGVGNDLVLTAGPVTAGSGGASALDFGSANSTRRLTTSSLEALNDTTGWAAGVWIRFGTFTGDAVFLGFGTSGAASSFQLRTFGGTQIGAQARDASGANTDTRVSYPAAGDYLLVAQYSDADGGLRMYLVPKGGTVSAQSDGTTVALATITPGSGWYIGSDGTSWTKFPLGEAFVVNRRLTNAELTTLAAGAPINAVVTPRLYWPLRNGAQATEANQGAATSADATLVGSGYAIGAVFFGANPHLNNLVLRRTDKDGVVSVLVSAIQAGTTITYKQQPADIDATITGTHQPIDSVTKRPGAIATSNTVGPVTGVRPSGGTVTVSPSGSQAAGTDFTANFGTGWTTPSGSNTYRGRWYLDTVPLTADYSSASPAFDSTTQQVGELEFGVIAKSGLGIDSVEVFSNTVTLTGTPTVSATSPAQFAGGHLYLDVECAITPAVWNVTGYTVLGYDIRRDGVVIRSRTLQTVPKFTPRPPPHPDGAVVDGVFDVSEYISYNGGTYWSTPQALTLEDTPGDLTASTLLASKSATSGASTSFTPTGATGGVAPRRATDISPALPGTFALAEDGSITGAFGGTLGNTVYTVTWTDNAGITDTADFTFSVVAAGVAALSALALPTPVIANGGVITRNVVDPRGSGQLVTLRDITNPAYPANRLMRAEDAAPNTGLYPGRDYWMAFAVMIKTGQDIPRVGGTDDEMLVFQTHTPAQGATNPDISLCFRGQDGAMRFRSAYNASPSNLWAYNWNGTDAGGPVPDTAAEVTRYSESLPAAGTWIRIIIHYRPGYTTGQGPRFRAWRALNGAAFSGPLFDSTGLNTYNSLVGPSYPRIGPYKWSDSAWKSASQAFYTSPLYFGEGADLLEAAKLAVAGYV